MLGIGFDSGGTHTSYALKRAEGPVEVSGSESPSSISNSRHHSSIGDTVEWICDVIASQNDDEVCAWIGAAGFSATTADEIVDRFERPMEKLASRFESESRHLEAYIANDAVAILKAPPLLGSGVAAIVGTGSVVMGTHPACPDGVIKRGGYEWIVSDEGAGVWMTLECLRLLIKDIHDRGALDYHSILLDRLTDFFGVAGSNLHDIPSSHRALAKIDFLSRKVAESRHDVKRFLASFVYPHLFDLAELQPGKPHDPIAAEVIGRSVEIITGNIRVVTDTLSAYTADEPNRRESLAVVIGGNIAANPIYNHRLRSEVGSTCRFVSSVEAVGDAGAVLASLALEYLRANNQVKRQITKNFDALHPVRRLV